MKLGTICHKIVQMAPAKLFNAAILHRNRSVKLFV